jgi:hypothetical protein
MVESYPPDLSVEEIKVKIQQTSKNPNIGKTHQVILKNGPRTFRIATIFEIMNPATNELHHLSLQLDSFDKTKDAWRTKPEKKIRIEGKDPNEIKILSNFLSTALSEHYPNATGEFRVVTPAQYKLVENLAGLLPKLPGPKKIELTKQLLQSLDSSDVDPEVFIGAFKNATPEVVKNIGVAAIFVQYKAAFIDLEELVNNSDPSESKYQNHLQKNPWMFGSEYSEILDRRKWTRDDNLDFMLRRTVDNYLEIIEIKTPAAMPIFNYDKDHDSFYASSKLSQVLGQVHRYIEEVERDRDTIIAKDRLDPLKIRARIIIGVDSDAGRQSALRTMNSHLHRVEIITFDQLLRVAKRTLNIFENIIMGGVEEIVVKEMDDDIPF